MSTDSPSNNFRSSHPEQGEQGEQVDWVKRYSELRKSMNMINAIQNLAQEVKLSSPPPEGQDERIKELENFLRTIRTGDLETIRKEASCLLIKK